MGIKAIQTNYNGYRFRSRLEARWAVFFDEAKIKYEYEPEGFTNEGKCYLPDFYLPEYDIYVEIKANADKLFDDFDKIYACMKDNATPISKGLLILGQIPYYDMNKLNNEDEHEFIPHFCLLFWDGSLKSCEAQFVGYRKNSRCKKNYFLTFYRLNSEDCSEDYLPITDDLYYLTDTWCFKVQGIEYNPQPSYCWESAKLLMPVFESARSARFEFKEGKK